MGQTKSQRLHQNKSQQKESGIQMIKKNLSSKQLINKNAF